MQREQTNYAEGIKHWRVGAPLDDIKADNLSLQLLYDFFTTNPLTKWTPAIVVGDPFYKLTRFVHKKPNMETELVLWA